MNLNPKVVPFERGADFIHQRAVKNLKDNNIVDALELLRSALEKSPDNDDYRLELAQLLCDAGCPLSSNKLLLDMLYRNSNTDECLYGLAINQLNMNNPEVARKLLRMCSDNTANDDLSAQVERLTGELDMYEIMSRPSNRRIERINAITDEACEHMRREDIEGALALFERALAMDKKQMDVQALLGMAYMMHGDTDKALECADTAAAYCGGNIRTLCVAAQVYAMADKDEKAREILVRAVNAEAEPLEKRMLVFSLFEAGMYQEARAAARAALIEIPCDKLMLHSMAVIALNMGEPIAEAARYWKRIMRIDPEDTVAEYYLKAADEDKLNIQELTCEYQVPRNELMRRYLLIADKLNRDLFSVIEYWKSDDEFRRLIGWCLLSGDMRFRDAAVTLLASVEDEAAESQLREYLMRADSGFDTVMRATAMYQLRGEDIEKILPPHMDPNDGIIPGADEIMHNMSVGHRQLVRYASEILGKRYGISTYDAIALLWEQYRADRGTRLDPLLKTETAAAALAYCYLVKTGNEASIEKLAAQFGCGVRQLRFFVRHMMAVLDKGGKSDGGSD